LLLALCAVSALAQTNKGNITGNITDPNGAAITNATVKITNTGTGTVREVPTNDEGNYTAPLLDVGIYTVEVTAPNFQGQRRDEVRLQTAETLGLDFVLQAGQVGDIVTVTAEAPLVQTETSDRGSVVTGREITELPLAGRNFTQLATLTPGVARAVAGPLTEAGVFNQGDPNAGGGGPGGSDARGSSEGARFSRSGGAQLTVNGQRPTNNNFSLDGVDNNEPQFGTIGVFPNPDAIAEFRVSTSVPPAEVGRAAGAVINTTTKSGTNEYHGSLYYYGENSALNAYHPVLKTDRAEAAARGDLVLPTKALVQVNEFGGTIGGRIIRDRTFFFVDYLGQRNNLPIPANTVVPTAGSRNGDFSQFTGFRGVAVDSGGGRSFPTVGTLLDPRTGQPFPNNRIPDNRINAVGRAYLNAYPLPTVNINNPGQFCDPCTGPNFFTTRSNKETIDAIGIKLDHRLSDNNSINGRFTYQNQSRVRGNLFPDTPTAGFGAGEELGNTRQLLITDTHTFSPTLLNEFRFGLTKIDIQIQNCGIGGACGVSESFAQDIGIPNVNDGSFERSGGALIGNTGAGFLEFTGDGGPFIVSSTNPYFADSLTIIHGSHVSKLGGELRLRNLDTFDGGRNGGVKGQFQFNDQGPIANLLVPGQVCPAESIAPGGRCFVDPTGLPYGGAGNSQANILLGVGANFVSNGSIPGGSFVLRSPEFGLFIQDDWKVNDNLTLNYGLRYDIFPSATEKDGRLSNFDINTRRVVVASGSGDRLIKTDKNNFGPRFGFAYAFGSEKKMVVRGGYGLLYTLDGVDNPPLIRNPPFTNQTSIGSNAFDAGGRTTPFNFLTGPPPVPTVDPANLPTNFIYFYQEPQQKTASVHQMQLSFQYQFARDYSIDIGYVGNRSKNLLATRDLGAGGTAQGRNALGQFLDAVVAYENRAAAQYDSMQVQVQKRLSNNVQGQISYTWGHAIDESTGVFNGIGDARGSRGGPINPFDFSLDRGNSSFDIRHLLSANAIIDLPFGKGQRFLNSGGVVDKIFGGFQVNLITNARTGFPFSVVVNDQNNVGAGAIRATQISDPFTNVPNDRYMNFAAFSTAQSCVTNAAGRNICFGSLGRNTFRGPSIFNTDMSVFKNTALREELRFQIGIEFFNLFNHPNYTVPNINATDTTAFGRFDSAYPGRRVQYRAKLIF
jgi:hypothetical protein